MSQMTHWRNKDRTPLKDVIPLDTPYNIQLETSSLCNLNCSYCAHSKHLSRVYEGNMTMEVFNKAIEDIKEFPSKVKQIEMFSFGEPLCNPNLTKMIDIVRNNDLCNTIAFTTNGLLFNKKNIDEIIGAGVDIIRVSLQGLDASMYKKVGGCNMDFDMFVKNLTYLYQNKKKCSIRMKIADVALRDIEDGEQKLQNIFGNISDTLFVEHIIPMWKDVEFDEQVIDNSMNGRGNIEQEKVNIVCHRPFYRLRVSADGIVTAACCDTPNDFVYGNINDESLFEIWNGVKHNSLMKMQLMKKRFENAICRECILPNDIVGKEDLLDDYAEQLLNKISVG